MTVEAGPNIVDSGLVLALDAANTKSYPGSGTTWTDLSGNANDAILVNNPTYVSGSSGYFTFNGTNTEVTSINASSLTNMTIEMWIYDTRSIVSADILTYNGNLGAYTFSNDNRFRTDGNGFAGRVFTSVTLPTQNQWYRFCYVKNGSLYINETSYSGTGADRAYGVLSFGNTRSDINNRLNGRISSVKIYNRNLSAAEISQNFNALRGRYGI